MKLNSTKGLGLAQACGSLAVLRKAAGGGAWCEGAGVELSFLSPTDQVELSPCRADRNTQCACKNGTFCSPDHPCEMCQKCQPE